MISPLDHSPFMDPQREDETKDVVSSYVVTPPRQLSGYKIFQKATTLPFVSTNIHLAGGRTLQHYHVHPFIFLSLILFFVLYIVKFFSLYFHNVAIQQALIKQGEPRSCITSRSDYAFKPDSDHHLPSLSDAVVAFWDVVGYSKRSTECEDWYRRTTEWNIPDPSNVAWLVLTSSITQPIQILVDGLSSAIESFFSRQSMLVTLLLFALTAYVLKLMYLQKHRDANVNLYRSGYPIDQYVFYGK